MKKSEKETLIDELRGRVEKAQGTFLVDFQGLDVEAINGLRNELRKVETEFQVVKNRLLKLACKGTETDKISEHMVGPTALVITYDDVVAPAKVLIDFAKDNDKLELKAGQTSGKVIEASEIKRLASLPSREILLSQVLSTMQAVPGSFVRVLNGCLVQFLNVLKAIEENKEN